MENFTKALFLFLEQALFIFFSFGNIWDKKFLSSLGTVG
jgi:hypothetical protein